MMWMLVALLAAQDMTPEQVAAIKARANPEVIREATLHPLFPVQMCAEHYAGQLNFPGDALGQDCLVMSGIEDQGYMALYRTDGKTNEDWYGWGETVHAPIAGTIGKKLVNETVNTPGTMGKPPAGALMINGEDGLTVVVAHLGSFSVEEGDTVAVGQPIGTIGNNGFSRAPHIHVGAFDKESALQIRWDLKALAALNEDVVED